MKSFKEFMLIAENILSEEDLRAKAEEVAREARRRRAEQIRQRATNPGTDLRSEAERVADQARQRRVSSQTPRPGLRTRLGQAGKIVPLGFAASHAASGEYPEAGLMAGLASKRLTKKIPQFARVGVQRVATQLGQRGAGRYAARIVPGLQQAYGIASGTRALARGDKLGAALGYASAIPGPVGYAALAADVGREFVPSSVKQSIKDRTGISNLQQRGQLTKSAIQSGRGFKGLEKASQTMGIRSSRQVAAQAGTYGAKKGSAVTGTGGPMTVNQRAGTITTGGRTVNLPKTKLLPGGKVGDLAYSGGRPVYLARPSTASRDTNVWRNLQRRLNIGGQRERDVEAARNEYRTALASTQKYTKQLGVTPQSATRQKLPGYGKK